MLWNVTIFLIWDPIFQFYELIIAYKLWLLVPIEFFLQFFHPRCVPLYSVFLLILCKETCNFLRVLRSGYTMSIVVFHRNLCILADCLSLVLILVRVWNVWEAHITTSLLWIPTTIPFPKRSHIVSLYSLFHDPLIDFCCIVLLNFINLYFWSI